MAPNFDRYYRLRERVGRFSMFHELRRRLYRSHDGRVLGVFKGIAESMGFSIKWTRIIGCFVLLTLAGFFGAHGLMVTLLVGGFFYLLAALLMQAPRPIGTLPADFPSSIPRTAYVGSHPAAMPYQQMRARPKVDLVQLDQQLDRLNHRIQRMETIVTDRQYDWERRLDS